MVFLLVFLLVVMLICAVSVWPRVGRLPVAAQPWRATLLEVQVAREVADEPLGPDPATAEGVLAAQLIAGDITRRQYADAMERLAS